MYQQVIAAGRTWRSYAQGLPAPCTRTDSGFFAVRHMPSAYYLSERSRCRAREKPVGRPTTGTLHSAVAAGTLPAFSMVTPDLCHDMHGHSGCTGDRIEAGDRYLAQYLPQVLAGPDFASGRLVVIITFDEGSRTSNHIPTVVLSRTTKGVASKQAFTHCSTLRTVEEPAAPAAAGLRAHRHLDALGLPSVTPLTP
nr:alkaline phosphatase family protein [Angustibacter aerolatus]